LQSRPSNIYFQSLTRDSIVQSQTKQKSQVGSMNTLLQTTRIQPTNPNTYNTRREREDNQFNKTSKAELIGKKIEKNSNTFFPRRSPVSWSVFSDQQILELYESSSSSSPHDELINDNLSTTHRLIITDEQKPLDGRYVIPNNKYVI